MEYLVAMTTHVPNGMPDEAVAEVRAATSRISNPAGTADPEVVEVERREAGRAQELEGLNSQKRVAIVTGAVARHWRRRCAGVSGLRVRRRRHRAVDATFRGLRLRYRRR